MHIHYLKKNIKNLSSHVCPILRRKTKIGKKIREAFIPETGTKFLSADYSQVELRVLAHLAQDSALIKAFQKGEDIHSYTANLLFSNLNIPFEEKRRRAKIINFSIIYGKTAYTLSKELEVDRKEAQKFIDDYFLRYGGVKEFINLSIAEAEKYGFVKTIFGRKRDIPDIKSNNSNIKSGIDFTKSSMIYLITSMHHSSEYTFSAVSTTW